MKQMAAAGMGKGIKSIKAFAYGFILFFILTVIFGGLLRITPLPEGGAVWYMLGSLSLACMFVGLYAGSFMKKRGFLYGAVYAFAFVILILAIAGLIAGGEVSVDPGQLRYLICILFGSIGGMFGVNVRL